MLRLATTVGILLAVIAGVLFLLLVVVGLVGVVLRVGFGDWIGAAYCLVSAAVNYLLWREVPGIERLVEQRAFGAARDRLLLWIVLGFLFFVVEGIVLLVAWLQVDSLTQNPLVAPRPTAPACPRCGGPLAWVPEYQRNYCPACATYV